MENSQLSNGIAPENKVMIQLATTYFKFAFASFTQKTRTLALAQWLSLQTAGFALTEEVVLLLEEPLAFRGGHPPAVGTCGYRLE